MPSRRRFLAAALGATTIGSTAGCLTALGVAHTGSLASKSIQVGWLHEGRTRVADLVRATLNEDAVHVAVAESYAGVVDSKGDIRLSSRTKRRLERTFESVDCLLGFCGMGSKNHECTGLQASQGDFNRVQLGDRAEVAVRYPRVHVVDVYPGADGDTNTDSGRGTFYTFNFSESYAHGGAPTLGANETVDASSIVNEDGVRTFETDVTPPRRR